MRRVLLIKSPELLTNFKELHEIVELAVNVTADSDGTSDSLDVCLFGQDLLSLYIRH